MVKIGEMAVFFLLMIFSFLGCTRTQQISLWERHCEACHDGRTVLNGNIVIDKEQMKKKYRTLDEFTGACANSPSCMNIVKHEEKLLAEVGTEIGIKGSGKK